VPRPTHADNGIPPFCQQPIAVFGVLVGRQHSSFQCVGVPHYHWYHARCLSENSLGNYFRSPIWPPNISGSYVYQKLPIVQSSQKGRRVVLWRILASHVLCCDGFWPARSGWAQPTVTQILWASSVFSSDSAPWELLAHQASPSFGLRRGEDVLWRFMSQHDNLTRSLTVRQ